ncbi:MAG: type IX secretion system membrane protein PorP/SprF [candidate division KSB1 bacterium]|nr:type IX secretion system membrane protein PorP/SprF [candidate division KSB1 bacterium]MDZ7366797.1 type IX secretion system membrane protein PorP/SprF [candidate division KSB1 bacterium]MDZ7405196.1 type IX secretion system membrane protein PorP/SprF [candidate division KSB1 bacterium]
MKRIILKNILLSLIIILPLSSASAQNLLQPHPLDVRSGQAHLLNPSIISYQPGMVQAGMRVFHLGFLDGSAAQFRLNYVSLVLPRWLPEELAFAVHAQSLNMPIYSQSYVSFAASRRFKNFFSAGLKAGLLSKSYDRDEFNLVDPEDPVFKNQKGFTRLDLGAGVTFWPLPSVSISLSRDHLNQPNVALGQAKFNLKGESHLALSYHFGNIQTAFITQRDKQSLRAGGFFQYEDPAWGFLRLGIDKIAVNLESRLQLYGPVSLNYAINYPTADLRGETSGSHEFSLVFELDRLSPLPKMETPPPFRYTFTAPPAFSPSAPRAYLRAENEVLEITAKRLLRIIEPDVPSHALAALSAYDLGVFDSSFVSKNFSFNITPIADADTSVKLLGLYSNDYRYSLRQLSENLGRAPEATATIVTNPFAQSRALGLRNYLSENTALGLNKIQIGVPNFANRLDSLRASRRAGNRIIVPREEVLVLNPQAAIFHIATANFSAPPRRWQLAVETETGVTVWKMEGTGWIPQQLVWNWRDNDGEVVAPGYYRYAMSWQTADGALSSSPSGRFYVKKFQRTVTIRVSRKFDGLQQPADDVKMILNR